MNIAEISEAVRGRYGVFGESGGAQEACCATTAPPSSGYATDLGLYRAEELAAVGEEALGLSRGCGNPTGFAELTPGDVVVDFGCGGGIDVILAARQVEPSGDVIGVDFAPQMIERATRNAAEAGVADRAEFRVADLAATGLPGERADVVMSNCVINLCPDKDAVYREAFRVLRPGGLLAISDVVFTEELPAEVEASFRSTWAGCVGGSIPEKRYFDIVGQAGFGDITVVSAHAFGPDELAEMACCPGPQYTPAPAEADIAAVQGKVTSIKFTARKPGP